LAASSKIFYPPASAPPTTSFFSQTNIIEPTPVRNTTRPVYIPSTSPDLDDFLTGQLSEERISIYETGWPEKGEGKGGAGLEGESLEAAMQVPQGKSEDGERLEWEEKLEDREFAEQSGEDHGPEIVRRSLRSFRVAYRLC
jgi:hypothetical protein